MTVLRPLRSRCRPDTGWPKIRTAIGKWARCGETNRGDGMTQFRLQASEYDCVPTCFINAYSRLFSRAEIPATAIQKTYLLCLDEERGGACRGTTPAAVSHLAEWLDRHRSGAFAIDTEVLRQDEVTLKAVTTCLDDGGVALLRVKHDRNLWHYVLALEKVGDWLECHDPYPKQRVSKQNPYRFVTPSKPQGPNLRIPMDWLDVRSNEKPFRLGTKDQRECVLMTRRDPRNT
ncbi:hypothetical protein LYB30171_01922 [Lysobacter luteus]|uniref:Peptidase C39 domain-containing protein n=1 Tax=Novilysobacter luteus TaxID=2822368 RepID=A0ABM8UGT0_9GAMM|nr:hypothetical protein LYB30171_01922 [Lysobacter luteus]